MIKRLPYFRKQSVIEAITSSSLLLQSSLYVCSKFPACDSYVRVHEGTTIPVGTMANGELKALRDKAHKQFDKLHQNGLMSKDAAYRWLAGILQAPQSEAHIG